MDNGVNDKGEGVSEDNDDTGVGATDDNIDKDGDGDGATDNEGDGNFAVNDDDDDDDDGDEDDVDDDNLPPCVGKRNNGCNETKTEEEETVADSVVIHTTMKQITGSGDNCDNLTI